MDQVWRSPVKDVVHLVYWEPFWYYNDDLYCLLCYYVSCSMIRFGGSWTVQCEKNCCWIEQTSASFLPFLQYGTKASTTMQRWKGKKHVKSRKLKINGWQRERNNNTGEEIFVVRADIISAAKCPGANYRLQAEAPNWSKYIRHEMMSRKCHIEAN